ncbi:FecR family protein [Galbibacter sp. PAP.153]|uniref:FecR family protein n=1 Tax=Galbibacter sp. PAP.153 TaxID=3104623 RepID=UPI00300AAE9A
MEDKKHDIDFFLKNEHFVKWVHNPTEAGNVFWEKWLEANPKDKQSISTAKSIIEKSAFKAEKISSEKKDEILKNILKVLNNKEGRKKNTKAKNGKLLKNVIWIASAAAIFALVITIYPLIKSTNNPSILTKENMASVIEVATNRGEQKTVLLPDSTIVVLNAESKLVYPSAFNSISRNVEVIGEAYFKVTHNPDKKFTVSTNGIKTIVHGTTFNIRSYPEMEFYTVALESGSVAVETLDKINGKSSFFIQPNEKIDIQKNFKKVEINKYDKVDYFGWKDGVLVFEDCGLTEFIAKIERWYNVDISVVGNTNGPWKINGMFKKQSIENVMKSLEFARKIKYRMDNNQITIYINN